MRLSHSALSTYKKCPRKFQFRYVDKVKVERVTSPAMERGLSIHQGLENFFLSKGESALPSVRYVVSLVFPTALHSRLPTVCDYRTGASPGPKSPTNRNPP